MTLEELIKSGDVEAIRAFMSEHNLVVHDGKIVPRDAASKKKLEDLSEFWGQRQLARKILLNSLYGALLNEGLRFYSEAVGQSVTLTGRSIVRHMNAKVNEVITQAYDYTGDAIVYADTDSCYFTGLSLQDSAEWRDMLFAALHEAERNANPDEPEEWVFNRFDFTNRKHIIRLYDEIAEIVNASFPDFMMATFNTSNERGGFIKAGRELVASKSLFIKKKKYAALMYDKDGKRLDKGNSPGKLKAMGLDLKRADTPKFMQRFLEEMLLNILTGTEEKSIMQDIRNFREDFKPRPSFEKGSPKKVNGLTKFGGKLDKSQKGDLLKTPQGKVQMPGHVRASLNWNTLLDLFGDRYSMRITDGARIVVCKLKPNIYRMDSIAYPIDEPHLPQWFRELPFDDAAMEETIIDNKVQNLIEVLHWDLMQSKSLEEDDLFYFPESTS